MTVYEIPNIEHCDVVERLNGRAFMITAHEGWYIHLHNGVEETENSWCTVVILYADEDFSIVEIRAEADLPEGAEINGNNGNVEVAKAEETEEVM